MLPAWKHRRAFFGLALLLVAVGCESAGPSPSPSLHNSLAPLLLSAGVRPLDPPLPASAEMVRLGQALFFDKVLSGNRDIACSTCHNPVYHTSDQLMLSIGTGGHRPGGSRQLGTGAFTTRHATDLFDRGQPEWQALMWDGRVEAMPGGLSTPLGSDLPPGLHGPLAAQALLPLVARIEMRGATGNELAALPDTAFTAVWDRLMARLRALPGYDTLFAAAYPGVPPSEIGITETANAVAAFIGTTWATRDAPFDRYLRGDTTALGPTELRGAILFFGRARCGTCHRGPLLTDQQFHNTGIPVLGPGLLGGGKDIGRAAVTGMAGDRYRFRTPPLRNVSLTAPYMHNGTYQDLQSVVRHYRDARASLTGFEVGTVDARLQPTLDLSPATVSDILATLDPRLTGGIRLSEQDVTELVAFLASLTDPASGILLGDVPPTVPSGLPVFDH